MRLAHPLNALLPRAQQVREEELAVATLTRQVEDAKREAAALSAGARAHASRHLACDERQVAPPVLQGRAR
jgi:hypothetical protein